MKNTIEKAEIKASDLPRSPGQYLIVSAYWRVTPHDVAFVELDLQWSDACYRVLFGMRSVNPEITRNRFWDYNPLGKVVYFRDDFLDIPGMETKIKLSEIHIYDVHSTQETDI